MVDIVGVSRELCGGTHVHTTAEIGLFHLTNEASSASNVRRVEAVTGPGGIDLFRRRTRELQEIAALLKVPEQEVVVAVEKLQAQLRDAAKRPRQDDRALAESLTAGASEIGGIRVVAEVVEAPGAKALFELSDRVKQSLGDSAVVLGTAGDGRVHLVANFAPSAGRRGAPARELSGHDRSRVLSEGVRSDEERQRARMEREARRAGRDIDGMYAGASPSVPRPPGRPRHGRGHIFARRFVALLLLAAVAAVA